MITQMITRVAKTACWKLQAKCLGTARSVAVALLLVVGSSAVVGTTALAVPLPEVIPLSEVSKGMTGYGLTVFSGSVIDTFGVTVIGVQERVRAAGSLILIEVSGHNLELSSIAQGMSGSPIYLNGRFAGALAFGWGGSLRPIAGVTPAADMLALPTDVPVVARPRAVEMSGVAETLVASGTEISGLMAGIWGTEGAIADLPEPRLTVDGWPDAQQMWLSLARDLAVVHPALDSSAEQWLFQPLGLSTAAQGNGTTSTELPARLVPGAACAVPLVMGDAALGAIGTVTWVDGDQVLMMGHPFMQRGPVNLPLATAEVLTILPSRAMSFKLGSVGEILGTVHHDLRAGLSGRMGAAPQMIPVTVVVHNEAGAERRYNFEIINDPFFTPTLAFWTLYNGLLVAGDDASMQTIGYEMETRWQGLELDGAAAQDGDVLVSSGVTAGPGGASGLAREVMGPLSALLNNPYREVRLQSVSITLKMTRPVQTARVVSLTSPRSVLRAGEDIIFRAEIEPRLGQREILTFPVTLPSHLPAGPYRVVLASAADLFTLEAQRAAGKFQPENLSGLVDLLRTSRSRDTLVLALFAPGNSPVLKGQEFAHLPNSVARTVGAGNMQVQRTMADYVWRTELATPWVLTGHAVRGLRIQPAVAPVAEQRRP